MKTMFALVALVLFAQTSSAFVARINNYQVVNMALNEKVYSPKNPIVQVQLKGLTLALSILDDICRPAAPGMISCKAMPIPLMNNTYTLKLIDVDSCGVKIYESNTVPSMVLMHTQRSESTKVILKNYMTSMCDAVYISQYEVTLQVIRKETPSSESEVFESYIQFNKFQ